MNSHVNQYTRQGRVHTNYNLNPVSDQERMNAKEALASLRMKTNSQRPPVNTVMPQYNNNNGINKYTPSYIHDSKLNKGLNEMGMGIYSKGINSTGIDRGGYKNDNQINQYKNQPRQPLKYQYQPQNYPQGSIMPRPKLNTTNSTRPRMNINQGFNSNTGGMDMEDNRPLNKGGDMNDYDVNENETLSPCPDCDKMFAPGPLSKHIKICKKVFGKQRKAFDTKKMRIVDSEQASLMKQGEIDAKKREKALANKRKSNGPKWKKQSEELRRIAQLNKDNSGEDQVQIVIKSKGGQGMVSNTKTQQYQFQSSVNDDYVLCKYCNRSYAEETYNKHAPGCERRFKEKQMKNGFSTSNHPKKNFQSKPFGKR